MPTALRNDPGGDYDTIYLVNRFGGNDECLYRCVLVGIMDPVADSLLSDNPQSPPGDVKSSWGARVPPGKHSSAKVK